MKKTKRLILIAVLVLVACLACFFLGKVTSDSGNQKMSAIVIENQLSEIKELASIEYSYTNMAKFENSKDFYGMKLPFTTKSFIITYDGEIKAGVDLSKAEVSVKGNKVSVTLPDAEIFSHEIKEDSIRVYDENTSIFNSFKMEDYTAFVKDQKGEMEKKAEEKGILKDAKEKAAKSIKELISQILSGDYTVTVK